uniref:Uncharacterized protein n=1 Tax=Anguilla anguilla TaxID=7936 RepID=A0A0E9QSC2_ANGAN
MEEEVTEPLQGVSDSSAESCQEHTMKAQNWRESAAALLMPGKGTLHIPAAKNVTESAASERGEP